MFFTPGTVRDNNTKTMMQSIKYAAKIVLIWVLFYRRSFDEQVPWSTFAHLSYKSLSVHFSLLVVMFLPIYTFGCHSNQSNSAFWTKCIYSEEDYLSNISIKLFSTYLQWVGNKGILLCFPSQMGHLFTPHPGFSCSSASSLVDCFWVSPLPKWSLTISSSSCIGIQRKLVQLFLL